MNENTTTVTETKALSAKEIQARTLEKLRARTITAAYEATEARLMMEKEEATPEEGTPCAFTNHILSTMDKVMDYQDALIYEARALKAYAKALEFYDGANRIKMIKDLRACAAARFKTQRGLEIKKEALRAILYGEK